jgi:hypothetical protein
MGRGGWWGGESVLKEDQRVGVRLWCGLLYGWIGGGGDSPDRISPLSPLGTPPPKFATVMTVRIASRFWHPCIHANPPDPSMSAYITNNRAPSPAASPSGGSRAVKSGASPWCVCH